VIRLRGVRRYLPICGASAGSAAWFAQLSQTEASVAEYAELESRRLGIQVSFALMFSVIALTILMASILIG